MANYTYSSVNGVIIPDTADIKTQIQNEYTEAFQDLGELSLEESTPQGRLIDLETNARVSTITLNAENANVLINIALSAGPALDAWGENFGIPRNNATKSSTPVTVGGVANTVITAGSQAIDVNGVIWSAENEIIIGSNGTASGTFICQKTGAVALATGELNKIVSSGTLGIDGWETITNTAAATLGADVEADTPYKIRLLQSIFNGSALFGNYASNVYKLGNVRDVYVCENTDSTTKTLDGITLAGHSVYVCIDGGTNTDVAYALYEVKSAGCGWNGNTTVVVTDKTYGTKNTVKYQIPTSTGFVIEINATDIFNSNANLSAEIKTVVDGYFNNEYLPLGYNKVGIRAIIEPYVIGALLQSQIAGITINSVKVGLVTPVSHAVADIVKASITSGIEWVSVTASDFGTAVGSVNGRYEFIYKNSHWKLNNNNVTLADYGISVVGTPISDDKISVLFATGQLTTSPLPLYANEKPVISDNNITVNING